MVSNWQPTVLRNTAFNRIHISILLATSFKDPIRFSKPNPLDSAHICELVGAKEGQSGVGFFTDIDFWEDVGSGVDNTNSEEDGSNGVQFFVMDFLSMVPTGDLLQRPAVSGRNGVTAWAVESIRQLGGRRYGALGMVQDDALHS
ncbi:hypothetical protein ACLOJK_007609, partial [Asimina triloba]